MDMHVHPILHCSHMYKVPKSHVLDQLFGVLKRNISWRTFILVLTSYILVEK